MDWFYLAKDELLAQLEENSWLDGATFIREYLLKNNEDFTSLPEEEQDIYLIDILDVFENYLTADFSEFVRVGKRYRWFNSKHDTKTKEAETNREVVLDDDSDRELLTRKAELLNSEEVASILSSAKLLCNKGDYLGGFDFALKYYSVAKKMQYLDADKLNVLSMIIDSSLELGRVDFHKFYCDKAEIYIKNYNHENAAVEYDTAIKKLLELETRQQNLISDFKNIIRELYRKCRIQYENAGDDDSASEIYVKENKYTQKSLNRGMKKSLMYLFWLMARYGESPLRVAGWAIFLIFACSLIYTLAGINPPGGDDGFKCLTTSASHELICTVIEPQKMLKVSYWSHLYYSVVTFTTLGYGDFAPQEGVSRFVSAFQALMGLILTSLFLATFIKKYSR